jgi:hypothetical protein
MKTLKILNYIAAFLLAAFIDVASQQADPAPATTQPNLAPGNGLSRSSRRAR